MNLLAPFVGVKIMIRSLFCERKQKNAIRTSKPLKGIKNAALSKDYSVE